MNPRPGRRNSTLSITMRAFVAALVFPRVIRSQAEACGFNETRRVTTVLALLIRILRDGKSLWQLFSEGCLAKDVDYLAVPRGNLNREMPRCDEGACLSASCRQSARCQPRMRLKQVSFRLTFRSGFASRALPKTECNNNTESSRPARLMCGFYFPAWRSYTERLPLALKHRR